MKNEFESYEWTPYQDLYYRPTLEKFISAILRGYSMHCNYISYGDYIALRKMFLDEYDVLLEFFEYCYDNFFDDIVIPYYEEWDIQLYVVYRKYRKYTFEIRKIKKENRSIDKYDFCWTTQLDYENAICTAVKENNITYLQELISSGFDLDEFLSFDSYHSMNIMHYAMDHCAKNVINFLIKNGYKCNRQPYVDKFPDFLFDYTRSGKLTKILKNIQNQ